MILNEYMMHIRHEEMLAEAERFRIVSLASRRPMRKNPLLGVALNWMGSLLSKWGATLQKRSGNQDILNQSQSIDGGSHA